jgi:hypothetical protein
MTDAPEPAATSDDDGQPTVEQAALAAEAAVRGGAAPPHAYPSASEPDERPELAVGAAFAGGLVLGLLLKRLAR